jgi:hypothetical protein
MSLRDEIKFALRRELDAAGVSYPRHTGQAIVIERLTDELEAILRRHLPMVKVIEAAGPTVISADPLGADRKARELPDTSNQDRALGETLRSQYPEQFGS